MVVRPLVSICIPTYNRAGIVGKAIESALAQSYPDLEIIVVDNASTDDTGQIVRNITDRRLLYHRNPENLGLFGNFNRCVELAKGEIIHILHSDDFIDPDFTQTCVRFFMDHPSVMLTFSSATIITSSGEVDISYAGGDLFFPAPEGFRRVLTEQSFIVCPSVMIRREVYQKFGRYSPGYPYSADLHYWLKISRFCDIGYVSGARLFYHQGQHSESYIHLFTNVTGYIDTLRIYADTIRSLGEERGKFNDEVTTSLYRYIKDCIFAGFTRIGSMRGFSPSFFTGTSLSAWSMVRPASFWQVVKKWAVLLFILTAGTFMAIPPARWIVSRFFLSRRTQY